MGASGVPIPAIYLYLLIYTLEGESCSGTVNFKFISIFKVGNIVYPLLLMRRNKIKKKKSRTNE